MTDVCMLPPHAFMVRRRSSSGTRPAQKMSLHSKSRGRGSTTTPVCALTVFDNNIGYYRTAPLLRPPFLRPTSKKKRGEGITTRICAFTSQLSPPLLPRICVLRSTKFCCAVEDENSFDRHAVVALKDGRVVGHVHVAIFWQVVSQPDSSHRPRRQDDGLRKPSEISEKGQDQLFSTRLIHEYNSSTLATHIHVQELQYRKLARAGRAGGGGGACNGGKITLYSNFARK